MFRQSAKLSIFTLLLVVAVIGILFLCSKIIIPLLSKSQPPISYNNQPANINSLSNVPIAPVLEEKKPRQGNTEFHTYKNFPLPTRVLVAYLDSLKIIETDGTESSVIPNLKGKSIRDMAWSPDGRLIALLYTPPEDVGGGGRVIVPTHLALVTTSVPYQFMDLRPKSEIVNSYDDSLHWSPDSKLISYVVNTNKGAQIEIMNIDTQLVISTIESREGEPIFSLGWIGSDGKIGYLVGHNLYLSTFGHKGSVVADDVSNAVCPDFEGPDGTLCGPVLPDWSPDGRYVVYLHDRKFLLNDTSNSTMFPFGSSFPATADYPAGTGLFGIGWITSQQYFFQDMDGLKSIQLPSRTITTYPFVGKFDSPYSNFTGSYQISPDGQYIASLPNDVIYKLSNGDIVCRSSVFNVHTPEGQFATELVWASRHPVLFLASMGNGNYAGKAIIDVNTCKVLRWMFFSNAPQFDPSR